MGEVPLASLTNQLLTMGAAFQEKVATELETGQGATRLSREALSLPRNVYLVRMNDTVTTAIWDTFIELSRRLRHEHAHMMRKIYLWELIEGPWPNICATFAERSQLQFTRATDTTATAYISHQMKASIAYKLEVSYRKMIRALCEYLPSVPPPSFAVPDRTARRTPFGTCASVTTGPPSSAPPRCRAPRS